MTAATTPTSTLTVNPDGSFTLTESPVPVRKKVNGAWVGLDATLVRQPDGTLTPRTAAQPLRLSGGGTGPLATLNSAGHALAVTAPMSLPAPTISGSTATYTGVLTGVDLHVTADTQGGFSSVLVVHDATAAANPALAALTFTTQAPGLTVAGDAAGNLTAVDDHQHPVFTAPTPTMWDSATPATASAGSASASSGPATSTAAGPVADPRTGRSLDRPSGLPARSTLHGPGIGAHRARIAVKADRTGVHLTPDHALLTSASTVWPAYLDPTWTPVGPKMNGWASISATYPSTNYWKTTPDPQGYMQVGNVGSIWSRTLINFPVPSVLAGATINSAALSLTENWSYSCTPSVVNVYAPATTLSSGNATWNAWSGVALGSIVASANVAHGYSSSCPAAGVGFEVKSGIAAAVAAKRATQTFALIAGNESSYYGWKEFLAASPTLSITYNHPPNAPSGLSTSPTTSCPTSGTPSTVGDADVMLNATLTDPDGTAGGNLTPTFKLWNTTTGATIATAGLAAIPSGSTAHYPVTQATLEKAAAGALTQFSWNVQSGDGIAAAVTSATCTFKFDPTRPGKPGVANPPADLATTVGQPVTLQITAPPTGGAPATYQYQLNSGAPGSVAADASGNAALTITPTRMTNTVTLTAMSAGGNLGADTAAVTFVSNPPASTLPRDINGDGAADLLTVGGTNNLPNGLWLAGGRNNGQVSPNAVNIGANGFNATSTGQDYCGAQAVTGHFGGIGFQDFLVYYPAGYTCAGMPSGTGFGYAVPGTGDITVLNTAPAVQVQSPAFADTTITTSYAQQIADAGNTSNQAGLPEDDVIAVNGNATDGYNLEFYPGFALAGFYLPGLNTVTAATGGTAVKTPTGGTDWNNWRITTTQITGKTAMYLFNPTTGALYLWTNLAATDNGDGATTTLTYTPYTIKASGWNTGASLSVQAADINADGTPDLWTTGSGPTTTAHLLTNLTTTPTLTGQIGQTLSTASHSWALADMPAGGSGTTLTATAPGRDAAAGLNLTSTGAGAVWNTGDAFSPDVALNGTAALTATGPAVATSKDFSVSAWVKPPANATTGVFLSQNLTNSAGFILYIDGASKKWCFGMATADTAAWQYNYPCSAKPAVTGAWSNITATYTANIGRMALYVNGSLVATGSHTALSAPADGPLQVGRYQYGGAGVYSTYFSGQISGIQTWNRSIAPDFAPPTHAFPLNDQPTNGAALTTVKDTAGTLTATAAAGVTGHTGDTRYNPDASFNGSTGAITASGPAIATNTDFTISAWAKPSALGGIIASQDGANSAGFMIWADTNNHWGFGIATSDTTAWAFNYILSGTTIPLNTWTHLNATYKAATGRMALYINGIETNTGTHTATTWNTTGKFQIGRYQSGGAGKYSTYFTGQIADVRTWQQTMTPQQVADQSGYPALVMFASDQTFYPSGLTRTTAKAILTFNAGLLTVTMTGTKTGSVSYGATGYPNAVFVMQNDGNAGIYKSYPVTTSGLWDAGVRDGRPDDVMIFQPDGNLVIYDGDGTVLWASGTNN